MNRVSRNSDEYLIFGWLTCALAFIVALAGCGGQQVDYEVMRASHAVQYSDELNEKAASVIPESKALTLDDCIRIALENNLDLRASKLKQRLATIDREIAFSNFLPKVQMDLTSTGTARPRMMKVGGGFAQVADRHVTDVAVNAQLPIFLPQTWYLYSMMQKGEDVTGLVTQRMRQLISLRVTAMYFSCLSLDEVHRYQESALHEAEVLRDQVRSLNREGLAMLSEVKGVETLVLARKNDLSGNRRARCEVEAELLHTMGLNPAAQISLASDEALLVVGKRELADEVLDAMLSRPELKIADRTIHIRKDEVRMAIVNFLPKLVGLGSFTHTSDSYVKHTNIWMGGISGVLTIFDGFRNVGEYNAAREKEKEAFIEREQACLMVILEVVKARLRVDETEDMLALARKNREAAEETLRELEARNREGLVVPAERLNAVTRENEAVGQELLARFQQQVAVATLMDVTGKGR